MEEGNNTKINENGFTNMYTEFMDAPFEFGVSLSMAAENIQAAIDSLGFKQ